MIACFALVNELHNCVLGTNWCWFVFIWFENLACQVISLHVFRIVFDLLDSFVFSMAWFFACFACFAWLICMWLFCVARFLFFCMFLSLLACFYPQLTRHFGALNSFEASLDELRPWRLNQLVLLLWRLALMRLLLLLKKKKNCLPLLRKLVALAVQRHRMNGNISSWKMIPPKVNWPMKTWKPWSFVWMSGRLQEPKPIWIWRSSTMVAQWRPRNGFHFGYDSRLKVRYVAEYPNGFCLFQAALKNHPPVVARMCGNKIFTAETDLVPHQDRYQDPFVSLRVYNMAGVDVLTFEFAFRPCTLGHTVLGAVARHLNLSKLQKSKLVLLRKDVKLKPGMSMRSWAPDHFVFPAKGSTVSLKRKLEEAGAWLADTVECHYPANSLKLIVCFL